jgi:hypothetical protein
MNTRNKKKKKYLLKGGAPLPVSEQLNPALSGNLSAGSNIPHLSPMQTDKSIVKPLSDSGVTVGDVPFSSPEQIQCVIDKGVPANLAKIMALRANNDCNQALEIYEGGWRNHVVNAADSWWPNQAGGKEN